MKNVEFDLISKLIRSRDPARRAAKLVLINGYTPRQAADEVKCSYNSVSNCVARFRATHQDIKRVFANDTHDS